jgi:hypothetical protein
MRRLVCFTVLALALAAAAAGFALASSSDDGTLSVKAGIGKVTLSFNGSAVGRVARGEIRVTDPLIADGLGMETWGCDTGSYDKTTIDGDGLVSVCRGNGLRFRAIGGKYQIKLKGSGIYLSAVGQGSVWLNGAGDSPDVGPDGTYSLNDQPYKSLPDLGTYVDLSAPTGG